MCYPTHYWKRVQCSYFVTRHTDTVRTKSGSCCFLFFDLFTFSFSFKTLLEISWMPLLSDRTWDTVCILNTRLGTVGKHWFHRVWLATGSRKSASYELRTKDLYLGIKGLKRLPSIATITICEPKWSEMKWQRHRMQTQNIKPKSASNNWTQLQKKAAFLNADELDSAAGAPTKGASTMTGHKAAVWRRHCLPLGATGSPLARSHLGERCCSPLSADCTVG